jgi:hypothetical protein
MLITKVLRGADPELFLKDSQTQLPVTSIGLIGGSKSYPRELGNGFALQEDNVTVEFNIPPCEDIEKFKASINYVLEFLKAEVAQKGLELDISATKNFTVEQLDHPQAQELGCEPDYNAWTNRVNKRPVAPETLRSSGGHIHIGYENPTVEISLKIVQAHDLFCGLPSLLLDNDNKRRKIYGKAGAHRIKSYGVEYRTLSNFWIKTPELTDWVYKQSEKAVDFVNKGLLIDKEDAAKLTFCINNGSKKFLNELSLKYGV